MLGFGSPPACGVCERTQRNGPVFIHLNPGVLRTKEFLVSLGLFYPLVWDCEFLGLETLRQSLDIIRICIL